MSGRPPGSTLVGGLEAGGTKFVCLVGTGPDDIRAETTIPTTTPAETLHGVLAFFEGAAARAPLAALGVASFGPLDLDPASPAFGAITTTPKPGWAGADLVGPLRARLGVPVGIDTDVNGAALAEHRWGAGRGLDCFVYVTVGTGIGGGGVVNGRTLRGLVHPEMGHVPVPHDREVDPYPGRCPYHGDCLEGLASGPALRERWGQPAETLGPNHRAWPLEARYLALGLACVVGVLSPRRIALGGGVLGQPVLLPLVRRELAAVLNGYLASPLLGQRIAEHVVAPALGARAGALGALALALDAAARPPGAGGA